MAPKTFVARPMNDVSQFTSQVDIIIPYHGQYEKVTQLMESIFRLTRSNYYQLYVVDDCSPNPQYSQSITQNSIKNAERRKHDNVVHVVRNEEQKGFAGACKVGYQMGESPYVCFINSDCLIKDAGWLRTMGESLLALKEQGVRMVAPVTDNAVGGDPAQTGDEKDRDKEDVILADGAHLSLYCVLCHRHLFDRAGGFFKEYPYGGYEDQEFAFRMQKHGFKQAVARRSWVHHEGQATIRSMLRANPNRRTIMEEENRDRCIADMRSLLGVPAENILTSTGEMLR